MAFKIRSVIVSIIGLLVSCLIVLVIIGSLNIHSGCVRATCRYERIVEVSDVCFLIIMYENGKVTYYPDDERLCNHSRSINDNITSSDRDFACYIYHDQYPQRDYCMNRNAFLMILLGIIIPSYIILIITIIIIEFYPDVRNASRCKPLKYVFSNEHF